MPDDKVARNDAEAADAGGAGAGAGGSGGKGLVIGLAVITLLAAAAGGGLGFLLGPKFAAAGQHKAEKAKARAATKEDLRPLFKGDHAIIRLKPVMTNLRAPFRSWARLEGALIVKGAEMDEKTREELALMVQQDVLAYLRTLALKDLEGASNLTFLLDDLNERARVRTDGRAEEFVLLSLVVE